MSKRYTLEELKEMLVKRIDMHNLDTFINDTTDTVRVMLEQLKEDGGGAVYVDCNPTPEQLREAVASAIVHLLQDDADEQLVTTALDILVGLI